MQEWNGDLGRCEGEKMMRAEMERGERRGSSGEQLGSPWYLKRTAAGILWLETTALLGC
jgi:hypothetical protein